MAKVIWEQKQDPDFGKLEAAADAESYEWLGEERPDYLAAVEAAVETGAEPREIRRFLYVTTERRAIALRCEQAARHYARTKEAG